MFVTEQLSGKFDVAAVSKIHFNVMFSKSKAASQTNKIFHIPQTPLFRRARASSGAGATA